MPDFLTDLRHATRALRRSPGVATVSILTLGLGIALSTIVFSIVYGVFIKGLPFDHPREIAVIQGRNRLTGADQLPISARDFAAYRGQQRSFSALAAYLAEPANIVFNGHAERFQGAAITGNTFATLGVRPVAGRDFSPSDDSPGATRVVLLGYELWSERFGASDSVIGTAIRINGELRTIVGVMPRRFRFPQNDVVWTNLEVDPNSASLLPGSPLSVWGRLRSDVGLRAANADIATIAQRLRRDQKVSNANLDATVAGWIDGELGPLRQVMYTMLVAALCVLLIGCANVANLLLERAIARTPQIGIRIALGAPRLAIARGVVAESLIIAAGATVLGLLLADVGVAAFNRAISTTNPPFYVDIALHRSVFVFTTVIALAASAFAALLPARQSNRIDINEVLKDGARGSSSLRTGRASRVLVIGGIALSCGLLVAAGLMTKSITHLANVEFGFATAHIVTAQVEFATPDSTARRAFTSSLDEKLRASTGIEGVSLSSSLPGIAIRTTPVVAEGVSYANAADYPAGGVVIVSSGFFSTFDLRALAGRLFTDGDRAGAPPVAIISQNLAARLFGRGNAIGKRIRLIDADSSVEWRTIAGVVPNTYSGDARRPFREKIYLPLLQSARVPVVLAVRSPLPLALLTRTIRDAVASTSRDVALFDTQTMEDAVAGPMWKIRLFGKMFVAFGSLALFLGAVGLYALIAFNVARRGRELGIRIALGAKTVDVLSLILRQGLTQVAMGTALGLGLALLAGQFLSLVLFDVQPRDPVVIGTVVSLLIGTGVGACLIPACRATRIDPLVSLRRG